MTYSIYITAAAEQDIAGASDHIEIRFTQIKNYLAFYLISEEEQRVTVIRFLYRKRHWKFILKRGFSLI